MSKIKMKLFSESGAPNNTLNWYGIKLNALGEPKTKYKNNKAIENETPKAKCCFFI
jgi:hypothetical protein